MYKEHSIQDELRQDCSNLLDKIKKQSSQIETLITLEKVSEITLWEYVGTLVKTENELENIAGLLEHVVIQA